MPALLLVGASERDRKPEMQNKELITIYFFGVWYVWYPQKIHDAPPNEKVGYKWGVAVCQMDVIQNKVITLNPYGIV
jgi:hypothetical protein